MCYGKIIFSKNNAEKFFWIIKKYPNNGIFYSWLWVKTGVPRIWFDSNVSSSSKNNFLDHKKKKGKKIGSDGESEKQKIFRKKTFIKKNWFLKT